jgi:hypothetical protein
VLQGADTCSGRDELSEQGEVAGDVRCGQPHSSGELDIHCFVVSTDSSFDERFVYDLLLDLLLDLLTL